MRRRAFIRVLGGAAVVLPLAASRFSQFAACSGAPSPKAWDYADFQTGLQQGFAAGEMGFDGHFAQQ